MTIVSKKELSAIIGITERTITNWEQEGLPIHSKGGKGKPSSYETKDVIKWQLEKELNALIEGNEDAKKSVGILHKKAAIKKLEAAGDREVLRLQKERGELLHVAEVEGAWSEILLSIRNSALAMPQRASSELVNVPDAANAIHILKKYVNEMLRAMAVRPSYEKNKVELPDIEQESIEELKKVVDEQ